MREQHYILKLFNCAHNETFWYCGQDATTSLADTLEQAARNKDEDKLVVKLSIKLQKQLMPMVLVL